VREQSQDLGQENEHEQEQYQEREHVAGAAKGEQIKNESEI
jgi:hypothetical protein